MRFLPEHRIRKRGDFLHCYDHGRRFFSSGFVMFVVARTEKGLPWRLGMAVTKKSGSAVWRNRTRRLIRESFRLAQTQIPDGYDYVIVPKRGLDPRALNLQRVSSELSSLLHSARKIGQKAVSA